MAKRARVAGMREERAQVWAKRAQAWRESGERQVKYCADHGLSVWVLRKWIVKLGRAPKPSQAVPALLPIPIGAQRTLPDMNVCRIGEADLEIALPNGARIRATGVIAGELTRAIARALRC